jgi:hypothetical protein
MFEILGMMSGLRQPLVSTSLLESFPWGNPTVQPYRNSSDTHLRKNTAEKIPDKCADNYIVNHHNLQAAGTEWDRFAVMITVTASTPLLV